MFTVRGMLDMTTKLIRRLTQVMKVLAEAIRLTRKVALVEPQRIP